jgi:lipopolysaccharide export system protein LptC
MGIRTRAEPDDQSWQLDDGYERSRSFRRARRHSFAVRALRTVIPAAVVIVVLGYAAITYFNPFGALTGIPSIGKMAISGTQVTMDLPKLAGYTRDGRQYELLATAAMQDLRKPALIELKEIRAKMEMRSGETINIKAKNGLYDTKAETVVMRDDVFIVTSNGTEVRLREASIDMRKGHVVSEQPVEILLANGRVDAKRLEVFENGAVLQFSGGVSVEMKPDTGVRLANPAGHVQ